MSELKIIRRARDIPINETVTKKTGTKEYILRRECKFFLLRDDGSVSNTTIVSQDGVVILVPKHGGGDAAMISEDREVVWKTTEDRFQAWLGEQNSQ